MLKRVFPIFLAVLTLAYPAGVYAAGTDEKSNNDNVTYTDNEMVSILTAGGTYSGTDRPASAYYPVEIKTVTEDGEKLVIKTYEVPSNVNPQQLVEDTLEKNGTLYEIRDILKRDVPGSQETKLASKVVTIDSKTKDASEIMKQLSPIIDFSEDGFTGQLQLDTSSIFTEADGYTSYKYPVTEVRQMAGMDRNDTYYIPKSANMGGVQMSLNNVQWDTMGCGAANNGRLVPNNFKAVAEYVGYATGSKATGYTATATYIGNVSRAAGGSTIYSLVYGPVAGAPAASGVLDELGNTLKASGEDTSESFGMGPFFVVAAVLLLGTAAAFAVVWLRKREPRPVSPKTKTRIYMPRESTGGDEEDE